MNTLHSTFPMIGTSSAGTTDTTHSAEDKGFYKIEVELE